MNESSCDNQNYGNLSQSEPSQPVVPEVLEPGLAIKRIFLEGLPNVCRECPKGTLDDTRVARAGERQSSYYSGSRFADPLCLVGISTMDKKHQRFAEYVTPRVITATRYMVSVHDGPPLSPAISRALNNCHSTPINLLDIPDEHLDEPNPMITLGAAVSHSTLASYADEAPIVRLLATSIIVSSEESYLLSTQLPVSLCYDVSSVSHPTTTIDPTNPEDVVLASFCYLNEFFDYANGIRSCSGWDKDDLLNHVIVIPITLSETDDKILSVKAMINTSMCWWYGRVIKSFPIHCKTAEQDTGDCVYGAPLASLLHLDSYSRSGKYKVLYVINSRNAFRNKITVKGPDTSVDIKRLGSVEGPTEIQSTILDWVKTKNFGRLDILLWKELCSYSRKNAMGAIQAAIAMVCETCFQLPMPKGLSGDKVMFGYCWQKYDLTDQEMIVKTEKTVYPSAILQDEFEKPDNGNIQVILNDFVVRQTTPSGLLCPGFHRCVPDGSSSLGIDPDSYALAPSFYSCFEADPLSRLALSFGILQVVDYKFQFHSWRLLTHFQAQASLQAGLFAWMAAEIGYTMFDICGFPIWDGEHRTLSNEGYDAYIAKPLALVTGDRIHISGRLVEDWHHDIKFIETFDKCQTALEQHQKFTISHLDGWSLPGWYISALKEKFSGTPITNTTPILYNVGVNVRSNVPLIRFSEQDNQYRLLQLMDCSDATRVSYKTHYPSGEQLVDAMVLCDFYQYKCEIANDTLIHPPYSVRQKTRRKLETSAVMLPKLRALPDLDQHGTYEIPCRIVVFGCPNAIMGMDKSPLLVDMEWLLNIPRTYIGDFLAQLGPDFQATIPRKVSQKHISAAYSALSTIDKLFYKKQHGDGFEHIPCHYKYTVGKTK